MPKSTIKGIAILCGVSPYELAAALKNRTQLPTHSPKPRNLAIIATSSPHAAGQQNTDKFDVDRMLEQVNSVISATSTKKEIAGQLLRLYPEDAKLEFWLRLRPVIAKLRIEDVNQVLLEASMVPGLPLPPDGDLYGHAKRIMQTPESLSSAQRKVWELATTVYPPTGGEFDALLKKVARMLAKFWDRCILFVEEAHRYSIVEEFGRSRPQHAQQVFLLSWLELPLRLQTRDPGPGKAGLFQLGRWFHARRARDH